MRDRGDVSGKEGRYGNGSGVGGNMEKQATESLFAHYEAVRFVDIISS